MLRFVVVLLLTFLTLDAKEHQGALAYLNTIRQDAGLIEFKSNTQLDRSAKSHADYLIRHQKNGHYEQRGKSGYTGRAPSDRVLSAGYVSKAVMENITVNTKTFHQSIDTLFAAIYHRFVFLNFDKDEIGIGSAFTKKKQKVSSSFVYDIGSSATAQLCKMDFTMQNGTYYIQNLCKNNSHIVPKYLYEQKQEAHRRKNSRIVLFPYPDAKNVSPVFYTEHPHPLPGSKVSGYPVSVQFNPAFYKKIKLKKFRLFDAEGKAVEKYKILTHRNDKNHRFTTLQFAFMPLKRLEYDATYQVEFEAIADGKRVKKYWKFKTKKPQGIYYKITKKRTELNVKRGERMVFYFEPKSNKDVLRGIYSTGGPDISSLDQNTLLVTIPKKSSAKKIILKAGGRRVTLSVL